MTKRTKNLPNTNQQDLLEILGDAIANTPATETKTKKTVRRRKSQNLVLEPRVLFDGAPVAPPVDPAVLADAAAKPVEAAKPLAEIKAEPESDTGANTDATTDSTSPAAETAAPVGTEKDSRQNRESGADLIASAPPASKLVLISDSLTQADSLADTLAASAEVIVIHADGDALQQISDILATHQNISELHIISHGQADALIFGNQTITSDTLNQNAALLQQWQQALTENADILLYGCDVGSEQNNVFLKTLQGLTAADIAASSDKTGDTALGGDALLEVQLGDVEATSVLSQSLLDELDMLLVDTVAPTVQSTALGFDGTNLTVSVQLSEALSSAAITGSTLVVTVAGVDRLATYDAATSDLTTGLVKYTVAISNEDQERGVTLGNIDAATIKDVAGNAVVSLDLDTKLSSINVGAGEKLSYNGVLTGAANLVKTGAGELVLTQVDTRTGYTEIQAGTLTINTDTQLGAAPLTVTAAAIKIGDGAILKIDGTITLNSYRGIELTGTGQGQIEVTAGNTLTYSGIISGSSTAGLVKIGTGDLLLGGTNTFSGELRISAGRLLLNGGTVIKDTVAVTVDSGATFKLNNYSEIVGNIAGAGLIELGAGTLTFGDATNTSFSGNITGTGAIIKNGAGIWTISGANTFSGATTINEGTIKLAADNAFSNSSALPWLRSA